MNSLPTLPPERDLSPATRQRQRAELTAIVAYLRSIPAVAEKTGVR